MLVDDVETQRRDFQGEVVLINTDCMYVMPSPSCLARVRAALLTLLDTHEGPNLAPSQPPRQ